MESVTVFSLMIALCLLIAVMTFSGGCTGQVSPTPGQGADGQIIKTISPAEARDLIEKNRNSTEFVIIDVRRPDEYASGHIEGAINIEEAQFGEQIDSLDKNGTYVVYCLGGVRSSRALTLMEEAGFAEVYEIEGGIRAWQAQGYPVAS